MEDFKAVANYDERNVRPYSLPNPLLSNDGKKIANVQDWIGIRRPEILKLFEQNVYGVSPSRPANMTFSVVTDEMVFAKKARRRKIKVLVKTSQGSKAFHFELVTPNPKTPSPVILGLNFKDDLSNWPLEKILERGFGVAGIPYVEIQPDQPDSLSKGVAALYPELQQREDNFSAISAWAWGLSRAMDYLETDPQVDRKRVALIGHSRLAKAALWAAARDQRFFLVLANDSGEGGAALARRNFGETTRAINTRFPHWFAKTFRRFNDHEAQLPVDQHLLLALVAPRPVYVTSASEDLWGDPQGEFLGLKKAEPVYRLFGLQGLSIDRMPVSNSPVWASVAYHVRRGRHDLADYDWEQFLKFMKTRK
ncbi:MAG: acetylxylan esterase [Bdellovibrio sp.]|nr:MAG: acetylxylan esterase [Bdellovibrio sp.]